MDQQQSAYQVALQEFRWVPGYQVTVRDWVRFCQYSHDPRFESLYWALDWGVRSDRLPCWVRGYDDERYFAERGQRLSSVQVRALLARAAQRLPGSVSQQVALEALQAEFGLVAR